MEDTRHSAPPPEGTAFSVETPTAGSALQIDSAGVPTELLQGDEVVIMTLKPSLWSVLFGSAQWVCGAAILVLLDGWFGGALSAAVRVPVLQIAVAVAALRIGFAFMQWASRVYVLTNRRIMRIRGVFSADLFECALIKIIGSQVVAGPHERVLRLGTIRFNVGPTSADGSWYHVARPNEVHARIRRAIERALDGHA